LKNFKFLLDDAQTELASAHIPQAKNEALLILSTLLDKDPSFIIARLDDPFKTNFNLKEYKALISRRCKNEPFAYLFNKKEFYNRDFKVGPGVLIPRPETEFLIEMVLEQQQNTQFKNIVDICCGSGIIGITLFKEIKCDATMIDISPDALHWAKMNIKLHNAEDNISLIQQDILNSSLEFKQPNLCVTINPPYISPEDLKTLESDVIDYEPHLALDGGSQEGLEFTLKCLQLLGEKTQADCQIFIELGYNQKNLLESQSLYPWAIENWKKDLAGIHRIVHLKKIK
jgi:release factor glutamine methyltransferase